jgi:sugar lactone lactonase YvrE
MKRMPALLLLMACGGGQEDAPPVPEGALPTWSYAESMIFPADASLSRPEDGIALPDGRLIVADNVHGLRMVAVDGSSTPFGTLAAAGYLHHPPTHPGGANSVSLEPGGTHLLVADVYGGAIYRVEVSTGAAEKLLQHAYGVNTAVRDSTGAIWFTQSAENAPGDGGAGLWAAIDNPRPNGALFRLAAPGTQPVRMVDSLRFANGVAIDAAAGILYVAETMAERVWRFRVDLATGTLSERSLFVDGVGADNLELDGAGNLWIAEPAANEVWAVNTATGAKRSVFGSRNAAQEAPLPGAVTGVIVGPAGPVYLTGLGKALLKLPR